jgi:hypothetical protein
MDSLKRSRVVALRIAPDGQDVAFGFYMDGNGNGVRTADIQRGIDGPLGPQERLADRFPGVTFGIARDVVAVDSGELLRSGSDPLRIGRSNILSFTPSGTATPGTLYIRSRHGAQYAVRVFGTTGRTRVLRYRLLDRQWSTP